MADARPVVMAAVAGAHGVRGDVRLKLFTASPDNLSALRRFDVDGRQLTLTSIRPGPQGAIAHFAEVTERGAAEALRGKLLTVPRTALPPLPDGEYYWHDLIGLPVETPDGVRQGVVVGVDNYGASDIVDIRLSDERSVLVPLIADAVIDVSDRLVVGPEWLA